MTTIATISLSDATIVVQCHGDMGFRVSLSRDDQHIPGTHTWHNTQRAALRNAKHLAQSLRA